ncbi:hypothetical protein [Megasphaera sp.]|uniref:hypothetical protein n=1 Tax=Megasphaera sp. TaxID=2023260 RepID=UPI0027BA19BD|nr:hypothetical protein [Megasphaera sp.]
MEQQIESKKTSSSQDTKMDEDMIPSTEESKAPEMKPEDDKRKVVAKPMNISGKEFLNLYNQVKRKGYVKQNKGIDVMAGVITKEMPVRLHDNFCIQFPKNFDAYRGCIALLTHDEKNIAAIGYLGEDPQKVVHLLFDCDRIRYELLEQNNQYKIILFPKTAETFFAENQDIGGYDGYLYEVPCTIGLKTLEKTKRTLCIDFGTSNTTVGSYGVYDEDQNNVEVVDFEDHTGDTVAYRKMLPTIIYVDKIERKDKGGADITYSFGYDALQKVMDHDYDTVASVFYEIKRWINNLDGVEDISDEDGNKYTITHKELIKQYLDYVINTAERFFQRKFTTLHFTAPVKLKKSFIDDVKKMYEDELSDDVYHVMSESESLDEGIAVVYQHIAKEIERYNSSNNKRSADAFPAQNILIIDCGGGTTDLARCTYQISKNQEGHRQLDITMSSENGDSNFGGNNITFRILQMIKIKLASKLAHKKNVSMMTLIAGENEILDILDRSDSVIKGCEQIYSKFETIYKDAEDIIPTCFEKEGLFQNEKRQIKRNFYYLWKMADAYKKAFYQTQRDVVAIDFNDDRDRALGIGNEAQYYLYTRMENGLDKKDNPLEGIKITIKEIECILYADIYALWKRILPVDDLVKEQYGCFYKLSGQSCRINLFHDLLKEFIPGRYLRYNGNKKDGQKDKNQESQLKLDCIEGSIRYIRDKEEGRFEPVIRTQSSQLFYSVYRSMKDVDHPGESDIALLERDTAEKDTVTVHVDWLPTTASRTEFIVFDQHHRKQNRINFEFGDKKGKDIGVGAMQIDITGNTYADLYTEGKKKIADDITSQLENNSLSGYAIFLVPDRNGYGFWAYLIDKEVRTDDEGKAIRRFCLKKKQYCSFEKEELVTFFDGKR